MQDRSKRSSRVNCRGGRTVSVNRSILSNRYHEIHGRYLVANDHDRLQKRTAKCMSTSDAGNANRATSFWTERCIYRCGVASLQRVHQRLRLVWWVWREVLVIRVQEYSRWNPSPRTHRCHNIKSRRDDRCFISIDLCFSTLLSDTGI